MFCPIIKDTCKEEECMFFKPRVEKKLAKDEPALCWYVFELMKNSGNTFNDLFLSKQEDKRGRD